MRTKIKNALEILADKGTIIYPTDTIYGLGCDATNAEAVEKIYKIKNRPDSKSLIILVDGMEMLQKYIATIPERIEKFLETATKPTTVIYKDPVGLASNVVASDNTVAIRIVQNEFCRALIREFGKPIVSTSANFSGSPSPATFDEIDTLLLKKADYIVNLPATETRKTASQIIRLNNLGEIEFLRK
ncbi:L-threonylcarbamoyladenylate synthase [Lutimonas zeaxanthinifaciens]|uniref:L-threonylcarbamoyladenylate synthase n=1 Tax=Lutimonas zeaxanthinifaciens TaxID=3060215 RepID=UPI00265CADA9|nr:L-threonylcarbamoyladenylate synthase [Lutimonas sp. YSD2104]WKK64930.1 L-threonylcarbamoyladenylate synthase [Lutimonas sp. YSD2104]